MAQPYSQIPLKITQLQEDPAPSDTGWMIYARDGQTYKVQVNALLNVSGVPTSRAIIAGTGLTGGGTLAANVTLSVASGGIGATQLDLTGVTAATYGDSNNFPVFTVDANGRITSATTYALPSTSGFVPTSRQIIAGTGLTGGGPLTGNVTLSAVFSNALPQALGTETAGVSTEMSRSDHVHPAVDLTDNAQTTGILEPTRGGTGYALTAPSIGGVAYSDGYGILVSGAGTAGQVLVSNGLSAPTWSSAVGSGTVTSVSGTGSVNGITLTGTVTTSGSLTLGGTLSNIGNSQLTNSSITINGTPVALGGSISVSTGDVFGPSSAVNNNFAAFDTTSGKLIKDSGYSAASFATAAQGAKADTAVQPGSLGTAAYLNAGVALGVATLDAAGKVPSSQLPIFGSLDYKGTWDALTNTPTLASGVGTKGDYYVVNVAGSTNLDGITDWNIGDWAVFNGTVWQKVDNTDTVTSVNGFTGTVVLTTTNINEGTNLYYTDARARLALSAGTGITYDNTTGLITNAAPDQVVSLTASTAISISGTYPSFTITNTAPDQVVSLTGAGTTSISGTYPNFTITSNDQYVGDVVGPASATDNALARFDTTTGKLIQNSVGILSDTGDLSGVPTITDVDYVDFDTTYATTLTEGQLGWNGNDTLGLGMKGGNVIQHIGEDQYFYCKATSTITKGQVIMFTGAVGASGVPTGAPATGITDGTYIMGIAAESIATNGFGLVQTFGTLRNINTSGYVDGDILWYDPTVAGGLTKTKPVAPNVKAQMAAVINGGSSGGGTILIRINPGSTLGGTDSNAEIGSPANGQIITYDGLDGYWKNTSLTAGTAISVTPSATGVLTVANTAPDQVVSLTGAGTTTISGTYPSFTITSNDQYVGTVTSVSVASANGLAGTVANATTTPAITLSTTVTGLLKGNGTVISAAVSGTDYAPATSGASILYGNNAGGFANVTIGSGLSFSLGTLSATSSMVYPGAGIPNSTGSAWGTSYTTSGTGTTVALTGNPTFASLTNSGNITFTGTGNRITGDFSNATPSNRVLFQSSTTNGNTNIGMIPNGTGNQTQIQGWSSTDPANASAFSLLVNTAVSEVRLTSAATGTGTYLPMTFFTNATERLRISVNGGFGLSGTNYGTSGQVLTSNGDAPPTWTTVGTGSGDVVGPSSATDNAIARFDGTTGKLIQNSAVTIDDTTGSMTFTGTAARIIGDMGNATIANRLSFQTSITNDSSLVQILPNGTSKAAGVIALNNSDPTNASFIQLNTSANGLETRIQSAYFGTGTYLPITFYTSGTNKLTIAADTTGTFNFSGTDPKVGIGIAPSYPLSIASSSTVGAGNAAVYIEGSNNSERVELRSGGFQPTFQGKSSGGTIASPTATPINAPLFALGGSGYDSSGWVTANASLIRMNATENWTTTAHGTNIEFYTTPIGSITQTLQMTIADSGNLVFNGTGKRITGDFSNATQSNQVIFQTSTTNDGTTIQAIPNGTSRYVALRLSNTSDPNNASSFVINSTVPGTEFRLNSTITGTGTYLPMTFYTNNTERMRLEADAAARIKTIGAVYNDRTTATSGNIDLSLGNNFTVAPTGPTTLTPSNFRDGQTGVILIANTSGYAISKGSGLIWSDTNFLATVSAPGVYLVSYFSLANAIRVSYSQNTQNLT